MNYKSVTGSGDKAPTVPVWLDCDPGNDDAFAILLAAVHPNFRLLGISTVHGNAPLERTTANALALLELMAFKQDEIKVYAGAEKPLVCEPQHAPEVHGESGLGGANLPPPTLKASEDKGYLEAMRDAILENKNEIVLVVTGAMTNYYQLVQKYPEVKQHIRYVSIMGGAAHCGNVTEHAEFNMYCDPHAAAEVLEDTELADKTVLSTLNITHTVLATDRVREAIYNEKGENNSRIRKCYFDLINFYHASYIRRFGKIKGPAVHDPLAMFMVLIMVSRDHEEYRDFHDACDLNYYKRQTKVVIDGEHRGETVIQNKDIDPLKQEKGGAYFGQSINMHLFWHYMLRALELADEQITARST
ncbi:hypothetical protein FT663_03471 [Candidozyma haemuli var. vulneris]|uniref:Inosine/uridine-preferring nucleoside hydrolase domain-containing protein n=1 Tax=Candidozyma haemuli TaxID=45357 RepID=A0A2V1AUT0_9ASCO|nr:hypothetical protein CXQ85_000540 [[Candida] haemuloni]KAF3988265.1 hypothetical protein FT662_03536 [[Candida] haemuloni var. vulneris]KAF3989810.1 hypothetical protein FT663_03471 [[Candida] haemuloni var. vulneris]PVH21559.1 hypothetical protein CXQ85_000540 [[Candida] haemuloni]